MDVRVLDRHSIGRVTHNTTHINLRVSGNHSGLEPVLPRLLPEVSTTCPGMSSRGLGRCHKPLHHSRGVPGPPAGVQVSRALLSLPHHQSYDLGIDLLPSTTPPRGRLYCLSGPEINAMETYIGDSLAAGFSHYIFFSHRHRVLLCGEEGPCTRASTTGVSMTHH
jgi:hypothetical protein